MSSPGSPALPARTAWRGALSDPALMISAAPLAASSPRGIAHGEYVAAAAQDRLAADTATAHAAGDRSAALLAAESFPCTAADAVTQRLPARSRRDQPPLI